MDGKRARARPTVGAAHVNDVCVRFRDARRDDPDAGLRDELHGDVRVWAHLAEIEDELGEILDRVDVVVRRWRDEGDARLRSPETRDLLAHLVCRDLASLARFRALRDLDLELVREHGVLGRHAEASRRDLLDPRVAVVPEPGRVLAALTRVRACAEAVQRDRDRLVRLRRERAVRHGTAGEPADDGLGRLDLVQRYRSSRGNELEQIARLERSTVVDERGEAVVEVGATVAHRGSQRVRARHRLLQRRHDVRVGRVRLAALAELDVPRVLELRSRSVRRLEPLERLPLEPLEPRAADRRGRSREEIATEVAVEADGFEEPRPAIARDVGDAHLGHDLEHALLETGQEPALRLVGRGPVAADAVVRGQRRNGLEREPRADRVGAVAEEARDRVRVTRLVGLDQERAPHPQADARRGGCAPPRARAARARAPCLRPPRGR